MRPTCYKPSTPDTAAHAAIVRADEARWSVAAVCAASVPCADHAAADAWDALARQATTQASDGRRWAALTDRTRRHWASSR